MFSTSFQLNSIHFLFFYIQTGDSYKCSYCFTRVVLGGQQCLKLQKTRTCWHIGKLSKISTGYVNHRIYFSSRSLFLIASFFDTFYIQHIFYYKTCSQLLRSIIEHLFLRRPPQQQRVYQQAFILIHTESNNFDKKFQRQTKSQT